MPYDQRRTRLLSDADSDRLTDLLQKVEMFLAAIIFSAGMVCVFLEKDWHTDIPFYLKIVPYEFIGIA